MLTIARAPIPIVVHQHFEDAASLRQTRSGLTRAPHVRLHLLRRLDDRIAASLDGVAVAGEIGRSTCMAALEAPARGAMFAATVSAIEGRDPVLLDKLLAIAEAAPDACAGLVSAFGWVSAASLRGVTKALFNSSIAFHREIGHAACAMHRVDPGPALEAAVAGPEGGPRSFLAAGTIGRLDLLPACLAALAHEDDRVRYSAARSCVLLGDRRDGARYLAGLATMAGAYQIAASTLVLKALPVAQAGALLKTLSQDPALIRALVSGIGAVGDAQFVPWLIKQMGEKKLARLAGESFSTITGADLGPLGLERTPPENVEAGPSDGADDDSVAMDEDDSLPWPDPEKVAAWWQSNGSRFAPGLRHFVGAPPSAAHCLAVLKTGYQRQRMAAAEFLSLITPGTPLFNTAAPAWRQQRWLDAMGG